MERKKLMKFTKERNVLSLRFSECSSLELSRGLDATDLELSPAEFLDFRAMIQVLSKSPVVIFSITIRREVAMVTILNCHVTWFWSC